MLVDCGRQYCEVMRGMDAETVDVIYVGPAVWHRKGLGTRMWTSGQADEYLASGWSRA